MTYEYGGPQQVAAERLEEIGRDLAVVPSTRSVADPRLDRNVHRVELLPLFAKLGGRDVLVVGGGRMGTARVRQLAATGARVTVVAPEILPEAAAAAALLVRRAFQPSDLDGMWFAVAAAPPEVNRAVGAAAEERRVLVNAVDDPEAATAYFPAVLRRGGATIAISTGGAAPALSGLVREALEAVLPDDLGEWVEVAASLRSEWKARAVPMEQRRALLLERLVARYRDGEAGRE